MKKEKPRPYRFTEAVGKDLSKSLENLSSEIMNDGAISTKEKSLIALACAVAVKCEHCVKAHKEKALDAGATMDEILEAAAVAGLVRLGSGFTTASYLLEEE